MRNGDVARGAENGVLEEKRWLLEELGSEGRFPLALRKLIIFANVAAIGDGRKKKGRRAQAHIGGCFAYTPLKILKLHYNPVKLVVAIFIYVPVNI